MQAALVQPPDTCRQGARVTFVPHTARTGGRKASAAPVAARSERFALLVENLPKHLDVDVVKRNVHQFCDSNPTDSLAQLLALPLTGESLRQQMALPL